jgi:tetratricopeptide (TPR) repeat protein
MTTGWDSASFEELDSIPIHESLVWHPVRKRFGIEAFGINAYTSQEIGGLVIEEHDELGGGASGHEEVYVVVNGHATFTIGDDTKDAPAGTLVYVADPALRRSAVSNAAGTLVLAIGGGRNAAYAVPAWEVYFSAMPLFQQERWPEAIAMIEAGLVDRPGHPAILYNLACAESRGGKPLEALTHLQQAIKGNPKYLAAAHGDPDFDPIRREPGFPA